MPWVTPAVRAELRRLKGDFDRAFARLDRDAEPSDPDYALAREAYRDWRVAIDEYGIALIDALDLAEATRQGAPMVRSPEAAPLTSEQQDELRKALFDLDRMEEMRQWLDE